MKRRMKSSIPLVTRLLRRGDRRREEKSRPWITLYEAMLYRAHEEHQLRRERVYAK